MYGLEYKNEPFIPLSSLILSTVIKEQFKKLLANKYQQI